MDTLGRVSREVAPVILPAHPRLRSRLSDAHVDSDGVRLVEPVGYLEMQGLIQRARGVITDSGGVQKEALFHGTRCLTLRDSTEWIESVDAGLNELLGDRLDVLPEAAARCVERSPAPAGVLDQFGGGRAGERIAALVADARGRRRRWRQSDE
jgi:UDP-N-acetylglucosamine 2-epimerase